VVDAKIIENLKPENLKENHRGPLRQGGTHEKNILVAVVTASILIPLFHRKSRRPDAGPTARLNQEERNANALQPPDKVMDAAGVAPEWSSARSEPEKGGTRSISPAASDRKVRSMPTISMTRVSLS